MQNIRHKDSLFLHFVIRGTLIGGGILMVILIFPASATSSSELGGLASIGAIGAATVLILLGVLAPRYEIEITSEGVREYRVWLWRTTETHWIPLESIQRVRSDAKTILIEAFGGNLAIDRIAFPSITRKSLRGLMRSKVGPTWKGSPYK